MREGARGKGDGEARTATGRGYRDLIAWQKAMEFAMAVYVATRVWPKDEVYGLTAQVRRSAVSIASNIAEGHGRSGSKEFLHHLSIAYGSLCEAETQLLLAESLGYLPESSSAALNAQAAEVRRLVLGLLRSLQR